MKMGLKDAVDKVRGKLRAMTVEDRAVLLFGASFFVGVWYAFPMVNTITDVWAFGGGVLRALEAHTLFPGSDVAYGTVSFYQNYLGMVVALAFALPFYGFDTVALKTALILNPAYSLMVPRLVSALTAVVALIVVHRFLKTRVDSLWWRLALLVLVFGNVLAALLIRSGKMWVLSVTLSIISFIYLYLALTEERRQGVPGRLSFISIAAAFLAAANFSFAGLFLVAIPIIFFAFPRTRRSFLRLSLMSLGGLSILSLFFALNAENTIRQLSEFVLPFFDQGGKVVSEAHDRLTFLESFAINGRHAVEAFPLLLLAVIAALYGGIRDRVLASLSLFYLALYIVAVALVFRTDHGLALNVRHIFPVGFFLMFFIASCAPPSRRIAIAFLAVGFAIYFYAIFLFSVPTTYNAAADFITERYGNAAVRIDENIFEFTLPTNKASYALYREESCGSTCQHVRRLSADIPFRPILVTRESDPALVLHLPPRDLIVVDRAIVTCTPIARFGNNVPDSEVFDMDINLGRMLMPSFYSLTRLGKNIYIYDGAACDATIRFLSSTGEE